MEHDLAHIEACCRRIIDQAAAVLSWQWDDHIGAMLAAFSIEHADRVGRVLDDSFASLWDDSSIVDAPAPVREIAESLGRLRSGQRLYVTPAEAGPVAFGAWWPWGNGETISLRIGLVLGLTEDARAERLGREFVGWFTASP